MIDDPFHYLTFGGTYGRTFQLFFDRFDLYMATSAVVIVPFAIFFVSAMYLIFWSFLQDPEDVQDGPFGFLNFGIEFLVYALATVIGKGAVMYAVAKVYTGEHPESLECLKKAWSRKWFLLGTTLLVDGSIFLGLILFVAFVCFVGIDPNGFTVTLLVLAALAFWPGVAYVYSGVMLVIPSIMVESHSPVKAVKRSWELSTGSRCYLVCTMMSLYFCLSLVNAFLINLFGSRTRSVFVVDHKVVVDLVIRIVPLSFYFPLHSIIQTVLYLNLRVGRESMNQTVLSGDLMTSAASLPSRFGNRDASPDSIDYRHVPLMDDEGDGDEMAQPNTSVV